jgi:membrane protease YdiL (CAAX protease family)
MLNDSSKAKAQHEKQVGWGVLRGVVTAFSAFIVGQLLGFVLVRSYIDISGHTSSDSTALQFVFILLSEAFTMTLLWLGLRKRSLWRNAGLLRPRWRDALYVVLGAVGYYVLYIVVISVATSLVHIDINQPQDVGFNHVSGTLPLVMTFISLVVLPPLVEEIVFRGVIFWGFRTRLPVLLAALFTSALFAMLHLPEGGDGKLLWIAGIDTFVLSMVLCYLREKTGSLWASIGVHAVKNGIAFVSLFILHMH